MRQELFYSSAAPSSELLDQADIEAALRNANPDFAAVTLRVGSGVQEDKSNLSTETVPLADLDSSKEDETDELPKINIVEAEPSKPQSELTVAEKRENEKKAKEAKKIVDEKARQEAKKIALEMLHASVSKIRKNPDFRWQAYMGCRDNPDIFTSSSSTYRAIAKKYAKKNVL